MEGGPTIPRTLSRIPADGGRAVVVVDFDGELWRITARDNNATPINRRGTTGFFSSGPTVVARPSKNGTWDIRVNGSSVATELLIEPVQHPRRRDQAHTFPPGSYNNDGVLKINSVIIPTGRIGSILGYRTAILMGQIKVFDTSAVDRIALYDVSPGASIITGGDLNTFNVYNNLTLSGGRNIQIGRDLNWWTVGGTVTIENGSNFAVGRDIGLFAQPPKGTDPGGQGGRINGNLVVNPGSSFTIGRALDFPLIVYGQIKGTTQISIPVGGGNLIAVGGTMP